MFLSVGTLRPAILNLFDEGGIMAGAEGGATDSAGTSPSGEAAPAQTIYGKSAEDAAGQTTPDQESSQYAQLSPEEKKKAYHDLIKGDFKDLFAEHTQQIINERFKKSKKIEARLDETQPVIDLLLKHYGAKSIGDLNQRIEDELLPDIADEVGMSPEAYKKQVALERENARMKQEQTEREMNARVDDWFRQAQLLQSKYPDFDLSQKADHPRYGSRFLRLLESGIEVEAAYLAAFHEEIIGQAQAETAKKTKSATLEAIKSGSMRPAELGAKGHAGIVRKSSVSQLSAEDRAEIAKRVARGEKIKF